MAAGMFSLLPHYQCRFVVCTTTEGGLFFWRLIPQYVCDGCMLMLMLPAMISTPPSVAKFVYVCGSVVAAPGMMFPYVRCVSTAAVVAVHDGPGCFHVTNNRAAG